MVKDKEVPKTEKRERFTGSKPGSVLKTFAALISVAIVITAAYVFSGALKRGASTGFFGDPVATPRSYVGKVVSMTEVEPGIDGDSVNFPLDLLEEKSIIYFEVENNEGVKVPLMAYITPSGRVFAGSSMCEPCRGRYFSLAGETLVCDSCRTTYTVEEHRFISGSVECGSYPPVYMHPKVKDGMVQIEMKRIREWRPRAF